MKKIVSYSVMLLLLAELLSFCTKSPINMNVNADVSIIGKWKLIKITVPFTPTGPISYDYSQYTIVYEFDTNRILTVSGEVDRINGYKGHETGEYPYIITESDNGKGQEGISYVLQIGDFSTYWYRLSSKELIIDASPVDGYIYYFTLCSRGFAIRA